MAEHDIWFDVIYDQLHILITIFTDCITKIHHIFRLQQEVHQHIFESHEEMKSFKYTGRHECHNQITFGTNLFRLFNERFPQCRIRTVCFQIRHYQLIFPFRNITDYLVVIGYMRHCCYLVFRPENGSSKAVFHWFHSWMTVASDIHCCRVWREECISFILFYQTIRFAVYF